MNTRTFKKNFLEKVLAGKEGTVMRNGPVRNGQAELVFRFEDSLYRTFYSEEFSFADEVTCSVVFPEKYEAIRYVEDPR